MAEYNGTTLEVKGLIRPCLVTGKKALFHRWFQSSEVVAPSPMVGGHPGGQLSMVLGLVEWEDGTVHAVPVWEIQFLDTRQEMADFEECYDKHAQQEKPTENKKAHPYGIIKSSISHIKETASGKQYSYAEGLLRMADITRAITKEQYEELADYLDSMKGYCYKDQEAEHLVQRIHEKVMHLVKVVPATNGPAVLFQGDMEKVLEGFFKNFKEELK